MSAKPNITGVAKLRGGWGRGQGNKVRILRVSKSSTAGKCLFSEEYLLLE